MQLQTDTNQAFQRGLQLQALTDDPMDLTGASFRTFEAREAARNWRRALDEHAHTSFYGTAHIQAMRAYWLGLWRGLSRQL